MSNFLSPVVSKLVPALSLETLDQNWQFTWQTSLAGRLWSGLKAAIPKGLAQLGDKLQLLSFLIVLALLVILGLPQLAGDKEALAIIIAAGFGLRTLGNLLSYKQTYRLSAIDIPVLAYLFSNIISTFASHYLQTSLIGLAKVAVYIAAYFLFTQSLQASPKRSIWAVSLLLLGGLCVALYGLYQYKIGVAPLATWEDPNVESKSTRIYSTLGNPNLLAAFLIPMIPLSLSLCIASFTRRKYFWSGLLLFTSGVITAATFLTGSRGAYLGLLAGFATFFAISAMAFWKHQPKYRIVLVLLLLVMPAIVWAGLHLIPSFEQRFSSIFAGSEHSSNAFRLQVWRASSTMFMDNWWFGIGPGNKTFVLAYGLYMTSGFDALGTYCVPLEIAVETGILGLASFGLLLVSVMARAHIGFWQASDPWQRWLAAGCAAGLMGMMVHGLVDTVFYRPQVQLIFWLLVAIVVSTHLTSSKKSSDLLTSQT